MDKFKYEPIDLEQSSFRLLRLFKGDDLHVECELFEAWLHGDNALSFEALSYTWGSSDTLEAIKVNGKDMPITENLFFALRNLRYPNMDRILWVDAICIDQRNDKERGHQVQQMGGIYSQADRVIFWLGLSTDQTDILMRSLKQQERESYDRPYQHQYPCDYLSLAQCSTFEPTLISLEEQRGDSQELIDQQRDGLQDLLSRSWFRRVWIIQEVANAKRAIVCCGSKEVNARIFALAPTRFSLTPSSHIQSVLDIMPGLSRNSSWWSQKRDLYTLLQKFRDSKASDPRDKVYALLGISTDGQHSSELLADYTKTTTEVIQDTTSFLFGTSSPSCHTLSDLLDYFRAQNTVSLTEHAHSADALGMASFLRERGDLISVTPGVIEAAAGNIHYGKEVLKVLLEQRTQQFQFKEKVMILKAAAGNAGCGDKVLKVLLEQRTQHFQFEEKVMILKAAAGNAGCGDKVLKALLEQRTQLFELKEVEMIYETAAGNTGCGARIIKLLYKLSDNLPQRMTIIDRVIQVAVSNRTQGPEILRFFLTHHGSTYLVEEILIAASKHVSAATRNGETALGDMEIAQEVARILIEYDGYEAITAAERCAPLMMPIISPQHQGRRLKIPLGASKASAENKTVGVNMAALHLERKSTPKIRTSVPGPTNGFWRFMLSKRKDAKRVIEQEEEASKSRRIRQAGDKFPTTAYVVSAILHGRRAVPT
ncbi:Nn.00g029200.m01.CDS01 [Neocucurbitaria sp. VM-36]